MLATAKSGTLFRDRLASTTIRSPTDSGRADLHSSWRYFTHVALELKPGLGRQHGEVVTVTNATDIIQLRV